MNWVKLAGERRIQLVAVLIIIALFLIFLKDLNPTTVDLNFGIEFVGGVRIPISLEKGVDQVTMSSMIDTIKTRINKYGLSQSVVRPLGDREIIVEVPKADSSVIKSVERILKEQGKFEAIIDGKEALSGIDIMPYSVGGSGGETIFPDERGNVDWRLDFAVTRDGAERFSKAASGKANYPVYLFLDRPENAVVLLSKKDLNETSLMVAERILKDALKKEGDEILLVYIEEFEKSKEKIRDLNKTVVVISSSLKDSDPAIMKQLKDWGFAENGTKRLIERNPADMTPQFQAIGADMAIGQWKAIGLLSAPRLSPDLAKGMVSQFYSITGSAAGKTLEEKKKNAEKEIRELKSVISGGRLPVSTVIGSAYTVSPTLGKQFLSYSWIGLVLAISVVAIIIIARYRKFWLLVPIVFVNSIEILVTIAIIGGLGTIDLAAMAGIISMIGTGVDDQIIITDEMLRKKKSGVEEGESRGRGGVSLSYERESRERLGRAFFIIFTVAGVSIASMFPLLISGIVEIMGFALSAIVGVLVGVLFTRPAYGVIIKEMYAMD